MNISEVELLSVLAQEMNMRKAAERLFVSQPALSQRLQSIERDWGAELFIRSHKGLTLTPVGELVISYANEVLEKEEKLREEIQFLQSEVHGTLKIACASIVGQNWLPKVLKRYVQKYPQAKISLITGWSSEILKAVYEDQVHVGIIRGTPEWKGIKNHLFKDRLYLVDREIEKIEDVIHTNRPFIQFKSDSNYYQEIQDWWHHRFQTSAKRVIIVDQIETCKQMVLNGIGYAILPEITLHGIEENLSKIPLLNDDQEPIGRDTWLLGYSSAFQLKQVKAFHEVVKEFLQEGKMN
ncbi:LysR family transcriptional regulator [Caldibacillus lycopersici]|uniref:LysR family transcriptional regulator n=1 Tax=Perspicuibacillus lycopersici TaxID=1325689 RepID=A0AAE3LS08_9BACI|nr:LysR family transcriptional regulator [Perspicuibacillus lycopersici]MCU9612268.1 LysR family transcriptional regulator [Perspicuibacillus lycopersici]